MAPSYIDRTEVEIVTSIKFLGVIISNELSRASQVDALVRRHNNFLRNIRNYSRWCTAQTITKASLPSMDFIDMAHWHRKAANKDTLDP
eukprot:g26902.t1